MNFDAKTFGIYLSWSLEKVHGNASFIYIYIYDVCLYLFIYKEMAMNFNIFHIKINSPLHSTFHELLEEPSYSSNQLYRCHINFMFRIGTRSQSAQRDKLGGAKPENHSEAFMVALEWKHLEPGTPVCALWLSYLAFVL